MKRLLGPPVSIRTRWVDPEEGESYEKIEGVDLPQSTLEQAEAALREIETAMAPADKRSLGAALAELWLVTAKQKTSSEDQEAKARVYIRELQTFPGDVALYVLRRALREHEWFPLLASLCHECAELARERNWLLRSLQNRVAELQRPAMAKVFREVIRLMPGCADSKAARSDSVSWSPASGNVERLAKHLDVTRDQAFRRAATAGPEELAELEAVVRRLRAEEG